METYVLAHCSVLIWFSGLLGNMHELNIGCWMNSIHHICMKFNTLVTRWKSTHKQSSSDIKKITSKVSNSSSFQFFVAEFRYSLESRTNRTLKSGEERKTEKPLRWGNSITKSKSSDQLQRVWLFEWVYKKGEIAVKAWRLHKKDFFF